MQELEKILEEINEEIKSSIAFSSVFTDGLCRARNIIINHLSRESTQEITRSPRDNDVTEYCPHCDRETTVLWDVEQNGYQIYCPNCGETIMLCSMCDREPCDWTENGCKYSDDRYGKRKEQK